MRVLYTNHTGVLGGAERCLLELLGALPAEIEPRLACPGGDLAERAHTLGVPVTTIRGTSASLRLGARTAPALAELAVDGLAIARIARRHGADLVHANSIRCGLMACATRAVPGTPPTLVHIHDCLPEGRASAAVRRLLRTGVTAFTANSRYTAEHFAPDDPASISVTYNPLDLERFDAGDRTRAQARRLADLPTETPLLGVVSQITPWKGQIDAVRALALVREVQPDAKLVLAGSAKFVSGQTRYDNLAYMRKLKAEVSRLALRDAVLFVGERSDVPQLLQALDVLLMPSWEEPFGRVASEAMAMGTATVATAVGGPPEFITDGETGVLVAPREPRMLSEAVLALLGDPARTQRIAEAGRAAVRARFGLDRFAADVVATYAGMQR